MKFAYLLLLTILLSACHHNRHVNNSFYYWKTVYQSNPAENKYLRNLQVSSVYVRIMDVDRDETGEPVPISPIVFKDSLPVNTTIIPVVFVVNDILKSLTKEQLCMLAVHIAGFVNAKVKQSGKYPFSELQIDCDWTRTTRDNYFYLLSQLKKQSLLKGTTLSATLRLHQLKNLKSSGVPPVNRIMLMCYNMGNLRHYGNQNSIAELSELKKYLGSNLKSYPLKADVALPLFNWAVAFRHQQYIGISKQLTIDSLQNNTHFAYEHHSLYRVVTGLPQLGLKPGDEVRWEDVPQGELESLAKYLSANSGTDTLNIAYFHLDENLLKKHPYESLEKVSNLLR